MTKPTVADVTAVGWAPMKAVFSQSVLVVMTLKAEPLCEGVWPHIGAGLFISHHY